jgi:hypothetical protein
MKERCISGFKGWPAMVEGRISAPEGRSPMAGVWILLVEGWPPTVEGRILTVGGRLSMVEMWILTVGEWPRMVEAWRRFVEGVFFTPEAFRG